MKKYFLEAVVRDTFSYAISVVLLSSMTCVQFVEGMRKKRKYKPVTAAAEARLARETMLREWDEIPAALPAIDAQFIRETRERLKCSRALFARRLCMNERTLEKWEQGRAKPNGQAAVLFLLVRHFPDTLERLRRIVNPKASKRRVTP